MSSVEFLVGYALLILVVVGVCWRQNRRGPSPDLPLPVVPVYPDPYSFAWFRGGTNETIRLGVYDLIRSGLMEKNTIKKKTGWFSSTINVLAPTPLRSTDGLHPVAAIVHSLVLPTQPIANLFAGHLGEYVSPLFTNVRKQAETDGLMHSSTSRRAAWLLLALAGGSILIIGAARLIWALSQNRENVGFIVVFTALGLVLLLIFCSPRRLTARGREWIQHAKRAYVQQGSGAEPALLTVALLGMSAPIGSSFNDIGQLFAQSANSSGGCGSGSCGSGTSCGSGCGGGGGCGGGD